MENSQGENSQGENSLDSFILEPLPGGEEPQTRTLTPVFTGSGGEYFRIWIVNVALTVLTLGIYAAWAKVRTRRYFYANTVLDGQPFDYLARPGAILRGYLIVGSTLLVMNFLNNFVPRFGTLFSAAALSCVPYLLYKAHRFKARYSAYRNVRFLFSGSVSGAYKAYILFPLAGAFSVFFMFAVPFDPPSEPGMIDGPGGAILGLIVLSSLVLFASYPYFVFLQRRYFHDNMAYGKTDSSFSGRLGPFYGIYVSASFMTLIAGIFGALIMGTTGKFLGDVFAGMGDGRFKVGAIGAIVLTYIFFTLLFVFIQQYVFAETFNYSWKRSKLGPIPFDVKLRARDLAWIRFSNLLAIFLSLGLLIPWAKVRRTKYVLSKTDILFRGDMEAFEADTAADVGAVGDTAADFFDWDIGW